MVKSYKDLDIWKRGIGLIEKIYKITKNFPCDESYGLSIQMKRCAISVPSNISEGFARQYNKEFKQFLYIALGSCSELDTQLTIAERLNYLKAEKVGEIQSEIDVLSRMIMSLIKKL